MQVGRGGSFGSHPSGGRVRNTWITCPAVGDSAQKWAIRPHTLAAPCYGSGEESLRGVNPAGAAGATARGGRRSSGCKLLFLGTRTVRTVPEEEASANYVAAAAVIRRRRALSGVTGRKGCAGGPAGGW